jgi:hypothetical protein
VSAFWNRIASVFGRPESSDPGGSIGDGRLLGLKLPEAKAKSSLFSWFFFEPVSEEKLSDGTTAYKPNGEAFRAFVTLYITTNTEGIIAKLHLAIAREFIDSPRNCTFAADLAKSFLLEGAMTGNDDSVSRLAQEITARGFAGSSQPVITRGDLPEVSSAPSAAYQTYAGKGIAQTLLYPSHRVQVTLENGAEEGRAVLNIVISPKT